ncbi:cytosolic carboxypeptidase 1 [Trichonephila clavipes]|nr:cytosolic carboxypeptidase 1 [Trichonephila clavipes]
MPQKTHLKEMLMRVKSDEDQSPHVAVIWKFGEPPATSNATQNAVWKEKRITLKKKEVSANDFPRFPHSTKDPPCFAYLAHQHQTTASMEKDVKPNEDPLSVVNSCIESLEKLVNLKTSADRALYVGSIERLQLAVCTEGLDMDNGHHIILHVLPLLPDGMQFKIQWRNVDPRIAGVIGGPKPDFAGGP